MPTKETIPGIRSGLVTSAEAREPDELPDAPEPRKPAVAWEPPEPTKSWGPDKLAKAWKPDELAEVLSGSPRGHEKGCTKIVDVLE